VPDSSLSSCSSDLPREMVGDETYDSSIATYDVAYEQGIPLFKRATHRPRMPPLVRAHLPR